MTPSAMELSIQWAITDLARCSLRRPCKLDGQGAADTHLDPQACRGGG